MPILLLFASHLFRFGMWFVRTWIDWFFMYCNIRYTVSMDTGLIWNSSVMGWPAVFLFVGCPWCNIISTIFLDRFCLLSHGVDQKGFAEEGFSISKGPRMSTTGELCNWQQLQLSSMIWQNSYSLIVIVHSISGTRRTYWCTHKSWDNIPCLSTEVVVEYPLEQDWQSDVQVKEVVQTRWDLLPKPLPRDRFDRSQNLVGGSTAMWHRHCWDVFLAQAVWH